MAAAEVQAKSSRQLREGCGTEETATYVAVPGDGTARWLLPVDCPEIENCAGELGAVSTVVADGMDGGARGQSDGPDERTSRRVGSGGRVDTRCGLDSAGLARSGNPDTGDLPGYSGFQRKAVVHLVDRASGTCRAIVKVPLTEEAKAAVLHEAEVLEALEIERYAHSPRLLHVEPGAKRSRRRRLWRGVRVRAT